jgi:hypothetical protein
MQNIESLLLNHIIFDPRELSKENLILDILMKNVYVLVCVDQPKSGWIG